MDDIGNIPGLVRSLQSISALPGGVSTENKHLLIVAEKGANIGIDIALLPSHTTHRLQPPDVAVFK